jgi:hypothetical protein
MPTTPTMPMPRDYDAYLDAAVSMMLASIRANDNALTEEASRLSVEAMKIRAGRDDDLVPREIIDAVNEDFRERLTARINASAAKHIGELCAISDPQAMADRIGEVLFADAEKLA